MLDTFAGTASQTAALLAGSSEESMGFMIKGLFQFELFGQELWITTSHVCILIVDIIIIAFLIAANRKIKKAQEIPKGFQNVIEMIVELIDNLTNSNMGKNGAKFANYIGSIFIFILVSNLSGLFGLRPPTADYEVTLPLGLMTFCIIQYNNVRHNKMGALKSLFEPVPVFFPVNLIGEVAVPISLSLRLFGNVLSGTVLMSLLYALVPIFIQIGLPAVLHIYFDIFAGAIQAYVFCMLTMAYVNDKIAEE